MDIDKTDVAAGEIDHHNMVDIDQTDSAVRNDDQYKARDDISDGELLEDDRSRSADESFEPEFRKKEHIKTWDKEKDQLKEKEVDSERPKDYERERDRDHNSLKEKEKLRDRDRHKDKDRRREQDRVEIRDRGEDKEKHRIKDREKTKERESGRDKDKDGNSFKHRDKEKDRERRKEKSKSKERDKEDDRGMGRRKDQDTGFRDAEKQERTKDLNKDIETDRDLEISKDRKERGREKDREREKEREKEKDRDREGREKDRDRHRDKDRDREKEKEREKEKDRDKEGREKDRDRLRDKDRDREGEKEREKDKDRDKEERDKDRDKLRDKDRDRERDKERDKDRDRDKEDREKDRDKSRDMDRDREKDRDRERTRDRDRDKGRDKVKERIRDRDRERDSDRDKEREKEERSKAKDKESKDGGKSKRIENRSYDDSKEKDKSKGRDNEEKARRESDGTNMSATELEERIGKLREERIKQKSEASEVLAWVNKSRKIEEHKNAEKEKAERLARIFEEQDNVEDTESDDDEMMKHSGKDLAGLKVLHGLDKVMEGGAVVLTLKDQNILAGGDVNDDIDMLENIEIGEQNARDEAYKVAKKKPGIYEDKFQNDINAVKTILPQYDDPFKEEGVTLDETGGINDESQKKLDEIRKRLQGTAMGNRAEESLSQTGTSISDYYTHDEMLQFKKPKKKKKLRKKDKLDVDALEAEAVASGLGVGDLGSRDGTQRSVLREEAKKAESEQRKNAYETAYNKAAEASRGLRHEKSLDEIQVDDDGDAVFGEEGDELYKSLEKARQAALKKQAKSLGSGPQAVARVAVSANQLKGDGQSQSSTEGPENKVVFTEMEEFVWGLQLDEESHKPAVEDFFKEDDEGPEPMIEDAAPEAIGGWTTLDENLDSDNLKANEEEEVVPDEIIKEASVGKGLAGALQLLKERGAFNETVDWGGRNMDKKKSKLVGVRDNDGPKEILLDRLDEFGRVMTPKEAFRKLSHKFHGKGPGKMKQEKRMKQYQEELKLKKMTTGDTPLMSMEKMRDVQSKLRTPYIVLSGQIKPGQTSDPRSGFATVEKEPPGSLTPMLGDRKVEHFLGIKRKPEVGAMGPPKKPKTS